MGFISSLKTKTATSVFASIILFSLNHSAEGTVAGPEYCMSGTYFDETLEDCLFTDGSGNNPDGTFCGLEGCYSSKGEFLGLSPHHPAAREECGQLMTYDWKTGMCRSLDLGSPPPTSFQIDWAGICATLQVALRSPCGSLVSLDGTLTSEGNRAVGCIRNGALLALLAGLNNIPLDWIIGGLQALEGPTGCSSIVNWEILNQIGSTDTILDLIPPAPVT